MFQTKEAIVLHWKIIVSGSAVLLTAALFTPYPLGAQERDAPDDAYASQMSAGEVSLSVIPVWEDDVLEFKISANTHSVDLSSLRLVELMTLVVRDTTWEPAAAGALEGHHAQATVRFDLPSRPHGFILEIRDVPDIALRRLAWPKTSNSPRSGSD